MTIQKVVDLKANEKNTSIDVRLNTSVWRSIAQDLERQIKSRELGPGDKLPTEQELSRRYMVNRHTVRRALSHLTSRGFLESSQGRGSFVRRPTVEFRIQRRTRFSDTMKQIGAAYEHRVLALDVRQCDARVAEALELKVGAPIVYLERMSHINDQPVGIGRHHFSFDRLPFFADMYRRHQSVTAALREMGILDYVRAWTRVHARMPTPTECDLLEMPRHIPILNTLCLNHDGLGRPLEYGDSRLAADRAEIIIEPEAEKSADEV